MYEQTLNNRWCSWCYSRRSQYLVEGNILRRNIYRCTGCGNSTLVCRYCKNMARTGEKWDDECCAVHDGSIGSFENLGRRIGDLTEFHGLMERRDGWNMVRVGKITAFTLGAAAVVGPLAFAAAPAVGGAVGSLMGLSGAAATSAGLAALGGGALAAGGLGMAGGAIVVGAVGAAAGGVVGGVVANDYFGKVRDFEISKLQDGEGPALIFVDGWLNQQANDVHRWLRYGPQDWWTRPAYHVRWESKTLKDLASIAGMTALRESLKGAAVAAARKAGKKAAERVGPLAIPFLAADMIRNPWHVALVKAEMTAELLKEAITRIDEQEFVLVGHSLGARVVYSTLCRLATVPREKRRSTVVEAHLMGGAVGTTTAEDWELAANGLGGPIHNYRSSRDKVLRYMYRFGTFFRSSPIGLDPIEKNDRTSRRILEHDVSELVDGHTSFIPRMRDFILFA